MSTTRATFGSLLGTIQTTAMTVTNVLDAANSGVGMLNSYVEDAATKQKARIKIDHAVFLEDLIREKSREEAQSTLNIQKFCSQSAEHKTAYENSYNKFSELMNPTQN